RRRTPARHRRARRRHRRRAGRPRHRRSTGRARADRRPASARGAAADRSQGSRKGQNPEATATGRKAARGRLLMTLATGLYDWLPFLHVLAAMIWLGAGVLLVALATRVADGS